MVDQNQRYHRLAMELEDVASRAGHPYARKPGLERFCSMQHLLVSLTGDAHGFVDEMLAKRASRAVSR